MPRLLSNAPRDYAWGSRRLLAELTGRGESREPEAEIWFGDHPADPADLDGGGTLDAVTGGTLPYLLKLLAVDAPLSIQAHPSRAQAEAGFAGESHLTPDDPRRSFRDGNHKPELIVALSGRFEALAGLRDPSDTLRLLSSFGDGAGIRALRARLSAGGDPRQTLRGTIGWLLSGAAPESVAEVCRALDAGDPAVPGAEGVPGEHGAPPEQGDAQALRAVRRIARAYPGDPGVVVALLMNHVVLRRGDGLFIPAGVLHTYLDGLGVEIMAASDNVLRGGLTPKRIDVPGLLAVLDPAPARPALLQADPAGQYAVPVPDFSLRRRTVAGAVPVHLAGAGMVLVTAGAVTVDGMPVPVGQAAFVAEDESPVLVDGHGEVFLAAPGA